MSFLNEFECFTHFGQCRVSRASCAGVRFPVSQFQLFFFLLSYTCVYFSSLPYDMLYTRIVTTVCERKSIGNSAFDHKYSLSEQRQHTDSSAPMAMIANSTQPWQCALTSQSQDRYDDDEENVFFLLNILNEMKKKTYFREMKKNEIWLLLL